MSTARVDVAVIGAGVFGVSCAVELAAAGFGVELLEQASECLGGATYANHNRHHYGYHYPRSLETARQCLESRPAFEAVYGEAVVRDFANYYAVAHEGSKTTPEDYLKFCRTAGLEHREEFPPESVLDRSKVALCLRVAEAVYEFPTLRRIAQERIKDAGPKLRARYSTRVVDVKAGADGRKRLTLEGGEILEARFVVNATYSYLNRFCDWMGFARREFQFNLQELSVIELPGAPRIGVTVQDGSFPSFIPLGRTGRYLMAHVDASQLVRDTSRAALPLLSRSLHIETNWQGVQEACSRFLPIVKEARYLRSILVDRVVDASRSKDDARLSEVMSHGHGCWSVFAAKVITSCSTAVKLRHEIEAHA